MVESNSATTPASEGFSWPAEWEHHAATWLSWPHNRETWLGCHEGAQDAFVAIVRALHAHEAVCVNVADEAMDGRVLVVHNAGYHVKGKVIQPAQVIVGKYEAPEIAEVLPDDGEEPPAVDPAPETEAAEGDA